MAVAGRTRKRMLQTTEMDLKPFMNLMVVLIPLLLLSAEFAKIAIIDIKLPENRGSSTQIKQIKRKKEDEDKLLLTVFITDSALTIGAKSGFLPSVFYREYHKYVSRDDGTELTEEFDPSNPEKLVLHPKTKKPLTIHERMEILLYAVDEKGALLKALYNPFGEMITTVKWDPVTSVGVGDTVFTLSIPRRMIVVRDPSEFILRPLSAYDELKSRLMRIKQVYKDVVEDGDNIIIAAENHVMYDKIVQIMDAARICEFPNISISKVRS